MSGYQQKDLSGSLFENDRKQTENQPDWTGNAMVGGSEFRVSAWWKQTKDGRQWLSLAFTDKADVQFQKKDAARAGVESARQALNRPFTPTPAIPANSSRVAVDFDDEVPF